MARIVVLASGTGSLLQALLDSHVGPDVVAVGSDNPDCAALERATVRGVPTFAVLLDDDRDRWNRDVREALEGISPDLIVCAGFMRILGPEVIDAFPDRIINSHPALLPAFPGAHAVRDALAYGVTWTGCTVHVVDQGVDSGRILAQQPVEVRPTDDEASLHERIKEVERVLLVDVVAELVADGIRVGHG